MTFHCTTEADSTDSRAGVNSTTEEELIVKWLENDVSDANSGHHSEDIPVDEEEDQNDELEELVIENITSHRVNKSRKYPKAARGEKLYCVLWY